MTVTKLRGYGEAVLSHDIATFGLGDGRNFCCSCTLINLQTFWIMILKSGDVSCSCSLAIAGIHHFCPKRNPKFRFMVPNV